MNTNSRIRLVYGAILCICVVFMLRLFYVQVIRYSYYEAQAQGSQLKRYEIPAERGAIYAFDGEERVPLVLNELRYDIVADPQIITDKEETALRVADVLGVSKEEIRQKLENDASRYEILAKKQPKDVKLKIEELYASGDIIGVFAEKKVQRVYPQGQVAAQVLGFVNDNNEGNYGVEESLDDVLNGTPGRVKALTDPSGVPLLASGDNIQEDPIDGEDITLTLNIAMQKQLESLLKEGLKNAKSESGSAVILDPNTGAVKAIANYPTYDPAKFSEVKDPLVYSNAAVSSPLEPGSIMKTLTAAAALDQGVVSANTSYYDPGFFVIDEATIRNVEEVAGAGQRTISDILRLSLNTGATYLLQQMGGGKVNEQARENWHNYMTEHYQLGKQTGIEQGFEEPGYIPPPNEGFGLNIQYANTAFGQGMTATPLQMASAVSSVINGGTYYQPHLVEGDAKIVKQDVVSSDVSATVRDMMANVVNNNLTSAAREGYIVGGKTGTAEIAKPGGGYYDDRFNGTYVGFVGAETPEYVVMIRVNEPGIGGYAGSQAAGPVFSSVINMLIDNFSVSSI